MKRTVNYVSTKAMNTTSEKRCEERLERYIDGVINETMIFDIDHVKYTAGKVAALMIKDGDVYVVTKTLSGAYEAHRTLNIYTKPGEAVALSSYGRWWNSDIAKFEQSADPYYMIVFKDEEPELKYRPSTTSVGAYKKATDGLKYETISKQLSKDYADAAVDALLKGDKDLAEILAYASKVFA